MEGSYHPVGKNVGTLRFVLVLLLSSLLAGCNSAPVTGTTSSGHSQYELEYRVLAEFPDVFWTDPDFYPVAREGQEQANALLKFGDIQANGAEFSAIISHLGIDRKDQYADIEKLLVYRQHKLLTLGVEITPSGGGSYLFVLRVREGQGERVEGTITSAGVIKVDKREPSINVHPICLVEGTLIDTPLGPVPVENVTSGTIVWTRDRNGGRVPAPVAQTGGAAVPDSYRPLRLVLDDGRTVTASSGHPTAEGRQLADYAVGDLLDGAVVVESALVPCGTARTFDLLPAGATGLYWANGIPLRSTLYAK
jgi:hypothetical protein